MYVRWKNRRRPYELGERWDRHAGVWRDEATQLTAVLVANSRRDGKPRQRYVATLASIDTIWLSRPERAEKRYDREAVGRRVQFWRGVRNTLADLVKRGVVAAELQDTLKGQVAKRVSLLTQDELAITDETIRQIHAMTPEQDAAMVQQLMASVGGRP